MSNGSQLDNRAQTGDIQRRNTGALFRKVKPEFENSELLLALLFCPNGV